MDNAFSKVHPELIGEWSERNLPITPENVSYGSKKIFWWKGSCGHEWQTSVKARSAGEKCPICSGARIIPGINDFATTNPELAGEWSDRNGLLSPTMFSAGSHKKIIWRGKCGHEWTAAVKSRTQGSGCPYCSHNRILPGFNDLASVYPELAGEWSEKNLPLLPTMVTPFANRKVWWRCRLGHEWNTLISTRSAGSRCPYCSGILLLKGFNDFASCHPRIAEEWSERNLPLLPDEVNEKSRKNVWWKCKACGFEWKSLIKSRVKGTQCPVCADRIVLSGYNDLATTDADLLSEWDYEKNGELLPEKVHRNSMRKVWWKCPLGHSWRAAISERTLEHKECTVCEKEYRSVFPQLAIKYYAERRGLVVNYYNETAIGIPIDAYIPEIKLAIDVEHDSKDISRIKAHLCKQRGIRYNMIENRIDESEENLICRIMKAFQGVHIFIRADAERDAAFIRQRFFAWRLRRD